MRQQTATLSTLIFILLLQSVPAQGQPVHALFRSPRALPPGLAAPTARHIFRSRLVEVDPGPLAMQAATRGLKSRASIELDLDLFDGKSVRAVIESVTAGAVGNVFEGHIAGAPDSSVVLTVSAGQMFGNVRDGDRWYQLRYAGDGLHAITEMNIAALGASLEPIEETSTSIGASAIVDAADDGSMIDLLVVYTPTVKSEAGGSSGIANLIDTAIAETNSAYQKSGVAQRVRLVHSAETVNWIENGVSVNADSAGFTFTDALGMVRSRTDGKMDQVHGLRDTYGADAVVLLVDIGSGCGQAYISSTADNAFAVVQWTCATGNYSFGHELGHNMGLKHERTTTGAGYAYGWADPNGTFRTIMATKCGSFSCGRIQHFSNPDVLYQGIPTGSPVDSPSPAHATRTLNEGAVNFSNFRPSVVAGCTYSLSAMSVSVASLATTGTVSVTAGAGCAWTAVSAAGFVTVTEGASGSGNGVVSYSVAANSGDARSGVVEIAGHNFTVNQSAGIALAPPGEVRADSHGSTVLVSWLAVPGATSYTVQRRAAGGSFTDVKTTDALQWSDAPAAGAAYVYRVRANAPGLVSAFSNAALATTVPFTDDPLSNGVIRAAHLSELRTAVNKVRALAGLAPFAFTDSVAPALTVRSIHVTELRTALDAALRLLALPLVPYRTSAAQSELIRASDFQELRDRVR